MGFELTDNEAEDIVNRTGDCSESGIPCVSQDLKTIGLHKE